LARQLCEVDRILVESFESCFSILAVYPSVSSRPFDFLLQPFDRTVVDLGVSEQSFEFGHIADRLEDRQYQVVDSDIRVVLVLLDRRSVTQNQMGLIRERQRWLWWRVNRWKLVDSSKHGSVEGGRVGTDFLHRTFEERRSACSCRTSRCTSSYILLRRRLVLPEGIGDVHGVDLAVAVLLRFSESLLDDLFGSFRKVELGHDGCVNLF
jgi:hypothetical protein